MRRPKTPLESIIMPYPILTYSLNMIIDSSPILARLNRYDSLFPV